MEEKNNTSLSAIKQIISTKTAFQYADEMLKLEKENSKDYYESMRAMWSGKDNPTLEECIEASRMSKLNRYAEAIKLYTGWISNGKVFVLDKEDKIVYFLYNKRSDGVTELYNHFNPLNVDRISEHVNSKCLSEYIVTGKYDVSADEEAIIGECLNLI